jgi:poly(3-hydroxybutyrate) depolymerase
MTAQTARAFVTSVFTALALVAGAVCVPAQDQNQEQQQPEQPDAAKAKQATPVELPHINFKSLDNETTLIAHLFRPPGDEPRAAVVMMHGCSGLLGNNGRFISLYRAWARTLLEKGYVVLVVDSAKSRGFGQTCSASEARAHNVA